MSFKELQKEDEILSREDAQVREMLTGLKRVEAPKDFDFRLKARIAAAKPADFAAPRLFPIFRYAAPLGLAIIVLGVLVFNGLYSFDNQTVPTIAENFAPKQEKKEDSQVSSLPAEQIRPIENTVQNTIVEDSAERGVQTLPKDSTLAANLQKPKTKNRVAENNGGGSKVDAVSNSRVILPKGLTPNTNIEKPQETLNQTSFSVKDVLSPLGIEAVYEENKWKVQSVKQNSLAERSGVKVNDVIEAIDENSISGETVFKKAGGGKNLNIVREGKKLPIKLQNK